MKHVLYIVRSDSNSEVDPGINKDITKHDSMFDRIGIKCIRMDFCSFVKVILPCNRRFPCNFIENTYNAIIKQLETDALEDTIAYTMLR